MAITRAELQSITQQQAARDAVLSGYATEWPAPDGAELVMIDGVMKPAATIANLPTGARVEAALQAELAAVLKLLKVKLPRASVYPARPVDTSKLDPALRASGRKANQLTLRLRDVEHRNNQLIQAEEAASRAKRERHILALRELLDQAPEKMRARAEAVGDLGARAQRIVDFLTDVSVVAGAVASAAHDRAAHELVTEAAAILHEGPPLLPQAVMPPEIHTLPVAKLATLLGVAPVTRAVDGQLLKRAQAAITALRGA